jgi:hypothetical protein
VALVEIVSPENPVHVLDGVLTLGEAESGAAVVGGIFQQRQNLLQSPAPGFGIQMELAGQLLGIEHVPGSDQVCRQENGHVSFASARKDLG